MILARVVRPPEKTDSVNCFHVADYFINVANDSGDFISNLKLQKLVYYAQAWHLALEGKPIFNEEIQAWVHGPVIPSLYCKYRHFKYHPIDQKNNKNLPIDSKLRGFLDNVCEAYMTQDAYALELMTHSEEPWINARRGIPADQNCDNIITLESMKEYYAKRLKTV